ncbi:pilus assembly protein TadG-related protein [Salinarimonas soli]|uniref:pilus assembly protein TadG-related protein n=1 Tax=Salinarimonas soli TaxID=1638099 RepID=UPI001661BC64|nr:pilus assembly protein TadG-related protein [Salinarimonas soli]
MAVVFALALIPMAGMVGAALDYSRLSSEQARLQALADRAAIAASLAPDTSDTQRIAVASSFFPPPPPPTPGAPTPDPAKPTLAVAVDGAKVTITTTSPVKPAVMGLMGMDYMQARVSTSAVQITTGRPVCVLALHPTARDAISFAGNTTFVADGCAIHANSTSGSAVSSQGSAVAKAWSFCAVGGVSGSNFTVTSPTAGGPKGGCFRQKDPFKNLAAPSIGVCTNQTTNVSVQPNQNKTLDPGTYCGGIDLKGTVTLRAGTYVIKGGTLSIASQANVTGEGVTFYLTDTGASFDINGGGTVKLEAPASGDYRNMLIIQNPASNAGATNKLNGNASMTVKGAIYTPTQTVAVTGTGGFGSTGTFMPLVASMISFSGNSTTRADTAANPTKEPLPLSEMGARLTN